MSSCLVVPSPLSTTARTCYASLYDELELVQSRSSADDDGPQLLDDNYELRRP
jgi:hypothetical protein